MREGGRAIVLVPEISLTPQTARRFEAAFGDRVAVLHSALSRARAFRRVAGLRARRDRRRRRRAQRRVRAARTTCGLIVVDESHDPSYKQEIGAAIPRGGGRPRANALERRRAGARQRDAVARELRGGEAPAGSRCSRCTSAPRRSRCPRSASSISRKEFESGNRGIFSSALVQALGERLERGEKSLLFVNRRGSAGALLCRSCGRLAAVPALQRRALGASQRTIAALPLLRLPDADSARVPGVRLRKRSRSSGSEPNAS